MPIVSHACGLCHGGGDDPAAKGWLTGAAGPETEFKIGPPPCGADPKATGCFTTRPRNLTPDNETGMGRFTERQLFNALRYGLRPEDTPDVLITSTTPGKGNFPMQPHYKLKKTWAFQGQKFKLEPGKYRWYLWPGKKGAGRRYGKLLGFRDFVITR